MDPERGASTPADCKGDVEAAYRSAVAELTKQGMASRPILTGLWIVTVANLLDTVEPACLVDYLEDATAATEGHGSNADSPLETLNSVEYQERVEQAQAAAHVFDAHLSEAVAKHEATRANPSRFVVEIGLDLLRSSWGGRHFRRILALQTEAVVSGEVEVVAPREPQHLNAARRRNDPSKVREATAPNVAAPVQSTERPRSPTFAPFVDVAVRLDVDVDRDDAIYATVTVARSRDGKRQETRENSGRVDGDTNGRTAPLLALADALRPFEGTTCRMSVDTSSKTIYDGMTDKRTRLRPDETIVAWKDLDRIVAGHEILWNLSPRRVDTDLCERTDRTLRIAREAFPA